MLKKQDYPFLDGKILDKLPLHAERDCDILATELKQMSRVCRAETKSITNFKLIQKNILYAFQSIPLRLAMLFLIVSNFVFTVMDLEHKDPEQDAFYSNVELGYTIIFSIELFFNFLAHAFWPFFRGE